MVKSNETVSGDVLTNLRKIMPRVTYGARKTWWSQLAAWKKAYPFAPPLADAAATAAAPGTPGATVTVTAPAAAAVAPVEVAPKALLQQRIVQELYAAVVEAGREADTVITTGVGQHQMFAAQHYRWRYPRR